MAAGKLSALMSEKPRPTAAQIKSAAGARGGRATPFKAKTKQLMPGEPPMPGERGYRNPLDVVNSDRGNV